jgi:hypothetical protein
MTIGHAEGQPKMNEIHVNHCVDILVQALQCSSNVNLITMHWVDTQSYPYPDMSINRQCVNFDKLTEWRKVFDAVRSGLRELGGWQLELTSTG